jgi:hypothetical protein
MTIFSSEPLAQISEENMSPEARKRHKEFSDMLVRVVVVVYFTSSINKSVCLCVLLSLFLCDGSSRRYMNTCFDFNVGRVGNP